MLTRPRRRNRQIRMRVVDGADVDGVDVGLLKHLPSVGEDRLNAGVGGELPGGILADIADRAEPDAVGVELVAGQMLPRNPACANQSNLQRHCHGPRRSRDSANRNTRAGPRLVIDQRIRRHRAVNWRWALSSVGQSSGLLIRRSWVRVPEGPPFSDLWRLCGELAETRRCLAWPTPSQRSSPIHFSGSHTTLSLTGVPNFQWSAIMGGTVGGGAGLVSGPTLWDARALATCVLGRFRDALGRTDNSGLWRVSQ